MEKIETKTTIGDNVVKYSYLKFATLEEVDVPDDDLLSLINEGVKSQARNAARDPFVEKPKKSGFAAIREASTQNEEVMELLRKAAELADLDVENLDFSVKEKK